MRISGVNFPAALVTSMRDGNLVIFAGAGVSMGEPSNLPDFRGLAADISQGTGIDRQPDEPEDRFLGRLFDQGVKVHEVTVGRLSRDGLQPTKLHRDLLRLFADGTLPRVVTTNFDLLFEEASQEVFGRIPDVYRAPALPLGRRFGGIVHIHGDVADPAGMVLTDKDFGRAYLTDGYSRLFLVELFTAFDVLFVGYSHNDTVMSYLARALPLEQTKSRFALTDDDKGDWWRFLGIEPVFYANHSGNHEELNSGISGLADNLRRGSLDWQQRVATIAAGNPMFLADEESDLIADTLTDVVRARFFTQAATDSEWIQWLEIRGHLSGLFDTRDLDLPERELARWLATNFALANSGLLFGLIASHGMWINPALWWELGRAVGSGSDSELDPEVLARWVSLLVDSASQTRLNDVHSAFFLRLSERCAEHGLTDSLLEIFDLLSTNRLRPHRWRDSLEPCFQVDHYELNEIWEERLRPTLGSVAAPLLGLVVGNLNKQFSAHGIWGGTERQWDPIGWDRSAIEPHEQDSYPGPNDVLIDAARDCLEYLATQESVRAAQWSDLLIQSDAALLRRLAVHILDRRQDLSADGKLDWLLANVDIHDQSCHHEVFRAVGSVFAATSNVARRRLIDSILSFRWPNDEDEDRERQTAYRHFTWLSWLCDADSDCAMSKAALGEVLEQYPSFRQGENPDFIYWSNSGVVTPTSPWPIQELVAHPAAEWLEQLLSFEGTDLFGPNRRRLLEEVGRAAVEYPDWGLELADALATSEYWQSDLWPRLLEAWSNEVGEEQHRKALEWVGSPGLLADHVKPAADVLVAIVRGGGMSYASALLELTNGIAVSMHGYLNQRKPFATESDWIMQAINHPAGTLAEYWLQSLSIWRNQLDPAPGALGDDYRAALSTIVDDRELTGTLGRAVLCSRLSFLLGADYEWSNQSLLPLFDDFERQEDCQAAWHGFLRGGALNPELSELMFGKFLGALPRLDSIFTNERRRQEFIGRYTTMAVYFIEDPFHEWIPSFFRHADSGGARQAFARSIGMLLGNMDDARQRDVWDRILSRYWEERLRGVPPPSPDTAEISAILDWLPVLGGVFPEAVKLATKTGGEGLDKHLLVHRIARGEFADQYPEATARLTIHLGSITKEADRWMWHSYQEFFDDLLKRQLPEDLETDLREMMAEMGLT